MNVVKNFVFQIENVVVNRSSFCFLQFGEYTDMKLKYSASGNFLTNKLNL